MQTKTSALHQISFLMPTLGEQLDPRQPLKQLADRIPWWEFEEAFGKYYSEQGRPAKPVRLMVGLLLLKQMFNQGDETVVAAWVQNPYWQYFCGMKPWKVHQAVNHSRGEYQRQNPDGSRASTNTAESFFSLLKRAIIGAWHHISREHLPRYANEFAFRWNTRHDTDRQRLKTFARWIEGKRLTYRQVSQTLCVC